MWNFISSIFSFLASWTKGRVAVGERNNTPEMQANAKAKDDTIATTTTEQKVNKAAAGDTKSLEELRRELGE